MGGSKKRFEPVHYKEWKQKKGVWEILKGGGIVSFMDRLHGRNPPMSKQFFKTWKKGMVLVENRIMDIIEDTIVESTSMSMEGLKFYKYRSISDKTPDNLSVIEKEKMMLVKEDTSY